MKPYKEEQREFRDAPQLSPRSHRRDHTTKLVHLPKINGCIDALLERNEKMLARSGCRDRDVQNLANWIENTASLAKEETTYLSSKDDLLALGKNNRDPVNCPLESPVEDSLIWLNKWTGRVSNQDGHTLKDDSTHVD